MDRREIIEQLQLKEHLNNEASNSPDASFKEDTNTLIIHKEWTPLKPLEDSQVTEPVLSEEELFQRLREQKLSDRKHKKR